MNVERLLYLPAAQGALGLRYGEGEDNVRKKFYSNIDIFRTFKNEGAFYEDLCLSRNNVDSFRMGWGGAIVFNKTGNQFEVTEISSGSGAKVHMMVMEREFLNLNDSKYVRWQRACKL